MLPLFVFLCGVNQEVPDVAVVTCQSLASSRTFELCIALRRAHEPEGESKVLRLAGDALLSADPIVRREGVAVVVQGERFLDVMILEPLLQGAQERFGPDGLYPLRAAMDYAALRRASRGDRIEVYRTAIESGVTVLPRGTKVTRLDALMMAAGDGIIELRPELDSMFSKEAAGGEGIVGTLSKWQTTMDTRAGAGDRGEAIEKGARAMTKFGMEEFFWRMRDPGFREAVLDTALEACDGRPLTEACRMMSDLSARVACAQRDRTVEGVETWMPALLARTRARSGGKRGVPDSRDRVRG